MKRDKFDVLVGWTIGLCLFVLLVVCAVAAPLAYLWIMGIVGSCVLLFGSLVACGSLCNGGGLFDAYIAFKIMEGTFQLIGLIFIGLAKASSSSSD